MILDSQTSLSRAQSIAASVGDVVSTDIYDTGAAADVGVGEVTYLRIQVNTAVTGSGASVQFILQTDDNSSFSSAKEYPLTAAIGVASLTVNSVQYRGALPPGLERYLRVVYRITGATTTAGTASAHLIKDVQANAPTATTVPGVK